jgi:hypothetical protein
MASIRTDAAVIEERVRCHDASRPNKLKSYFNDRAPLAKRDLVKHIAEEHRIYVDLDKFQRVLRDPMDEGDTRVRDP